MRILLVLSCCYFWFCNSLNSQSSNSDTYSSDFKYSIGVRYNMTHLTGNVSGDIELSQSPQQILISKKGKSDLGIYFSSESRFGKQGNLFKQIDIGFNTLSGEIEYKGVGGSSIKINDEIYERQYYKNIEFREFHLYTNYQVKAFVKDLFSISIGPQISCRLRNEIIRGEGESSLFPSNLPAELQEEYKNSYEIRADDNFIIAHVSLLVGIGKPFRINQSNFSSGINYTRGLTNFHNAGNSKISVVSFYLNYYL